MDLKTIQKRIPTIKGIIKYLIKFEKVKKNTHSPCTQNLEMKYGRTTKMKKNTATIRREPND